MAVTQVKEKGGERCDGFSLGCFALDVKDIPVERVSRMQLEIHDKHCKKRPKLEISVLRPSSHGSK